MNTYLKFESSLRNGFLFADGVYLNNITEYIDIHVMPQTFLYIYYTHVTAKVRFIYSQMQIEKIGQ
jgi:hypothetical protein